MWAVCGHAETVGYFQRTISTRRLVHAYLLTGPKGVGKSTLSLEFARALLCRAADSPCGGLGGGQSCRSCDRVVRGIHPDVRTIELDNASAIEQGDTDKPHFQISRDAIGELRSDAALKPADAEWKVYRVLDAHLLSHDAANRLLKTLEEPPPGVILILTAPQADDLLPTVVSRCQRIPLRPVPSATIASFLSDIHGIDPASARLLARRCRGRIGWAIQAATNAGFEERQQENAQLLLQVLRAGRLARLRLADELAQTWAKRPDEVRQLLSLWMNWMRDVTLIHLGLGERIVNFDRADELGSLAARIDLLAAATALRSIDRARDDLERNVNRRLAFDVALLELPAVAA